MLKEKFHIAVPTAFNQDESLNIELTIGHIENLYKKGVRSVLVCGSTGEQHSLSLEEKLLLLQAVNKTRLIDEMEIIFGVSSIRERDAVKLAEEISKTKIKAILLGFSPYILPAQDEALSYAKKIIEKAKKNVIIYNNPRRTGFDLSVQNAAELLKENSVIGLKEAGDPEKISHLKELVGDRELLFYAGGEVGLEEKIRLGFNCLSSILGNIDPIFIKDYYELLCSNVPVPEIKKEKMRKLVGEIFLDRPLVKIKKSLNSERNSIGICRKPLGN